MTYINTDHRNTEALDAVENGNISSSVASTVQGLLELAARGELCTFTKDGLKPLTDFEREQCSIANMAISQHFTINILVADDDDAIDHSDEEAGYY